MAIQQMEAAVNKESKPEANEPKPQAPAPPQEPHQVDAALETPATAEQLTEVEEQMTGFEKSTLRWAKTAVIMSAIAAIFVCAQWWEMHEGGKDTHDLAVAAGNQATWTQRLADTAKIQSDRTQALADRTKDLADRMKEQADRTKTIAEQAIIQAKAARSAATTAEQSLHISERAYVAFGSPSNDFQNGVIRVPVENTGRIPSGSVRIEQHEVTFKMSPETAKEVPQSDVIESHWVTSDLAGIPPASSGTAVFDTIVMLPKLVQSDLNVGKQGFFVVVVITYNDGFDGTPPQTWKFCEGSTYSYETKRLGTIACDPEDVLGKLKISDHYPDPNYQYK
jgi:hypothetical protein